MRALSPGQDLQLLAEALESVTKVFLTEIEACAATHRHICAGQHGELHRQRSRLAGLSRASYREGTTLPMRAYCRRCRGVPVGRTPRQAGTGSLTKLQFASYVMGVPWVVLYRNSLLEWQATVACSVRQTLSESAVCVHGDIAVVSLEHFHMDQVAMKAPEGRCMFHLTATTSPWGLMPESAAGGQLRPGTASPSENQAGQDTATAADSAR